MSLLTDVRKHIYIYANFLKVFELTNKSVVDVLEEALAADTGRELGRRTGSVP